MPKPHQVAQDLVQRISNLFVSFPTSFPTKECLGFILFATATSLVATCASCPVGGHFKKALVLFPP